MANKGKKSSGKSQSSTPSRTSSVKPPETSQDHAKNKAKRPSRAKYPKAEHIGQGPSGPIYTGIRSTSTPTSQTPQEVHIDVPSKFVATYPLNLDYDPYLVPETHTHYITKESRHARRKHAQAARWSQTVLPALIRPYMRWKRDQTLQTLTFGGDDIVTCSCAGNHRILKVVCVSIESMLALHPSERS
jgi:CCR4-NOT transcriptional regulation complex NOT5 subunit